MSAFATRWLLRLAVVRAIAIVATGRMTGLEASLEVRRRIRTMELPELLDLQYQWEHLGERAAPPSARPTSGTDPGRARRGLARGARRNTRAWRAT